MSISSSVVPRGFCGARVLLVEPDRNLLQYHDYMLTQNTYRVTSTTSAASALSMIMNGKQFDCVLVNADACETFLVQFVNLILKSQPQLSVVLMASLLQIGIAKGALDNAAILWLTKPCDISHICGILQHLCSKRPAFQQDYSNGRFSEEIFNSKMVRNNILPGHGTLDGLNAIFNTTKHKADKGKQKLELHNDEVNFCKKRKYIQKGYRWTSEHHGAYPNAILNGMNHVPGLTRNHVMSPLQNFQERENGIKIPHVLVPQQRGNNWHVENNDWKRSTQRTPSNNDASNIHPSNLQRPVKSNPVGTPYITLDDIMARLKEATEALPVPPVTATMNTFGGIQGTGHSFSHPLIQPLMGETNVSNNTFGFIENSSIGGHGFNDPFLPLMGETSISNSNLGFVENSAIAGHHNEAQIITYGYGNTLDQLYTANHAFGIPTDFSGIGETGPSYNLELYANNISNGLDNGNPVGGDGVSDVQAPVDCFGIAPLLDDHGYKNENQELAIGENSTVYASGGTMASPGVNVTGGSGFGEALAPVDCFGIAIEPVEAGTGGDTRASLGLGPEDLSYLESLFQSDDFQNIEASFPNIPPSTTLSDADNFINLKDESDLQTSIHGSS